MIVSRNYSASTFRGIIYLYRGQAKKRRKRRRLVEHTRKTFHLFQISIDQHKLLYLMHISIKKIQYENLLLSNDKLRSTSQDCT